MFRVILSVFLLFSIYVNAQLAKPKVSSNKKTNANTELYIPYKTITNSNAGQCLTFNSNGTKFSAEGSIYEINGKKTDIKNAGKVCLGNTDMNLVAYTVQNSNKGTTVIIYSLRNDNVIHEFNIKRGINWTYDMKFSPDDNYLVVGYSEVSFIFDLKNNKLIELDECCSIDLFNDIAYSKDSKYIAFPHRDEIVEYSLENHKISEIYHLPDLNVDRNKDEFFVRDICYINEDRDIVFTNNNRIYCINTVDSEMYTLFQLGNNPDADLDALAVSNDGKLLAASGSFVGGKIYIWSLKSKKLVQVLNAHGGYVNRIAFSPDDKWMISASDGTSINPIRIWKRTNLTH